MIPILLAGHGRAGTSAFMQMLATDPSIGFERVFPFERRELTYFAKLDLVSRRTAQLEFNQDHLIDFNSSSFGPMPWTSDPIQSPSVIGSYWPRYFESKYPSARFYAEKSPPWLAALVRRSLPCCTVYMLRDPRDLFLSAAAFTARNASYGFGKTLEGSEIDWARNMCYLFVSYFENYWSDSQRADAILIRYEDYAEDSRSVAKLLNTRWGTEVQVAEGSISHDHATSRTRKESIYRYRREAMSFAVRSYLEQHLANEMQALGYDRGPSVCPQVRFYSGFAPLQQSADGRIASHEEYAEVDIQGDDFWTVLSLNNFEANSVSEAWLSIQSEIGEYCSLYWRRDGEIFAEERSVHAPFHPGAHWQVIRFVLRPHPQWNGLIRELRLDIFNGHGSLNGSGRIRWFRLMR